MKTMKISDPGSYAAYDPKQRARQTGLEALPHVPNSDEANGFEAMILQEFLEKSKSQKRKGRSNRFVVRLTSTADQ